MRPKNDERTATLYQALDAYRDQCLRRQVSAFLPPEHLLYRQVWTPETAAELLAKFVERPDEGEGTFVSKLEGQLRDASPQALQLMLELMWLHLVIARQMTYGTKRKLLEVVAGFGAPQLPRGMFDDALRSGIANTGMSFNTHRPFLLWFLVRFSIAWVEATAEQRELWLEDPWAFRDLVEGLEGKADFTQRNALLHLVHPDTFEDYVSRRHKASIAKLARPEEVGENVDRTIANIRARLADEYGEDFTFYAPQIRKQWDTKAAPPPGPEPAPESMKKRAWFIRGAGGDAVPEWLRRGICAVFFQNRFPFLLRANESKQELRKAAEAAGVDTTEGGFAHAVAQVWRFLNAVSVGDYVVTVQGSQVHLGVVRSDPRNEGQPVRTATVRDVEWVPHPLGREDVSAALYSKLRTLLTLSDITPLVPELEAWAEGDDGVDPPTLDDSLTPVPQALADDLLLPREWLDEVVELLDHKRQIVLYGPPGTGKTFLAQRLVDHLTEQGGTSETVQFHPSYTYEDFFEGYRPVSSDSGQVAFELKPGPLRRLAEAAQQEPGVPHFLVVDEINRANLAKVFGELYFLLEYRDQTISLQYSEHEFALPANLFVIGTMNTADRSIALVDAAMRRRFYFVEMSPSVAPIEGLLERWLSAQGYDLLPARLLDELNKRLGDPDAAIGPSFFMDDFSGSSKKLERVWRHAILPLLRERFYGGDVSLDTFSLEAIRARVESGLGRAVIIELGEWETASGVTLSPEGVAAFAASDEFRLGPDPAVPGAWKLTATHHVGVAHLGGVEVRVAPKVPVHRLLELICSSIDRVRWDDRETRMSEDADLLRSITATFVHQVRRALRHGVLQGYRARDDSLHGVRGRIAVGRQLARQSGLVIPVEVSYDEYTTDILENQLVATAVLLLSRLGGQSSEARRDLRAIGQHLDGVRTLPLGVEPPRVIWTRLNRHYRPAVTLARLIIRCGSLELPNPGNARGSSFMVDMNRLFEDVVGRGIARALAPLGYEVDLQAASYLDDDQVVPIQPDVVVSKEGVAVAVADVKYKREEKVASTSDLFQALAYAARYQLPRATLVFPVQPAVHALRVRGQEVCHATIDLSSEPEERDETLRALAMELVGADAVPS